MESLRPVLADLGSRRRQRRAEGESVFPSILTPGQSSIESLWIPFSTISDSLTQHATESLLTRSKGIRARSALLLASSSTHLAHNMSSTHITALVLGSTGETGKQALLSALSSPSISRVVSFGRRAPELPPSTAGSEKLQHVGIDFDKLLQKDTAEAKKLRDAEADVVICALGTTRAAAGGMEGFVKIDREYVLEACKQARIEGKQQKLAYCSVRSRSLLADLVVNVG